MAVPTGLTDPPARVSGFVIPSGMVDRGQSGAPSFRAAATVSGTAGTADIAYPTGWQAGDLLVLAVALNGTRTVTTPSGWTEIRRVQVSTNRNVTTLYRMAQSGDSSPLTLTFSASEAHAVAMCAYSGAHQFDPLDADGGQENASGTACPAPSITTLGPNRVLVWVGVAGNRTFTPPSGYDERADLIGSAAVSVAVADDPRVAAGATGIVTGAISSALTNGAQLLAFRGP